MNFKQNKMSTHLSLTWLMFVTCFVRYVHLSGPPEYRVNAKLLIGEKQTNGRLLSKPGDPKELNVDEKCKRKSQLTTFKEITKNTLNIFFLEASCAIKKKFPNKGVVLKSRQVCAVESAARMNPSRPVYILHSCPLDKNFYNKSSKYFQKFWITYKNVHLVRIDAEALFRTCDLHDMYTSGVFNKAKEYMNVHLTDIMKIIALWLFGGTYMDMDTMNIRPLDDLGQNYAGWIDNMTLGTSVLNFGHNEFAQQFLKTYIKTFKTEYDPTGYFSNGPELFTNLMATIYGKEAISGHERNFTCYAAPAFYPIPFDEWRIFFIENFRKNVLNQLTYSYVVNFWNHMSKRDHVFIGFPQAYGVLACGYCPKTYDNCGEFL